MEWPPERDATMEDVFDLAPGGEFQAGLDLLWEEGGAAGSWPPSFRSPARPAADVEYPPRLASPSSSAWRCLESSCGTEELPCW